MHRPGYLYTAMADFCIWISVNLMARCHSLLQSVLRYDWRNLSSPFKACGRTELLAIIFCGAIPKNKERIGNQVSNCRGSGKSTLRQIQTEGSFFGEERHLFYGSINIF